MPVAPNSVTASVSGRGATRYAYAPATPGNPHQYTTPIPRIHAGVWVCGRPQGRPGRHPLSGYGGAAQQPRRATAIVESQNWAGCPRCRTVRAADNAHGHGHLWAHRYCGSVRTTPQYRGRYVAQLYSVVVMVVFGCGSIVWQRARCPGVFCPFLQELPRWYNGEHYGWPREFEATGILAAWCERILCGRVLRMANAFLFGCSGTVSLVIRCSSVYRSSSIARCEMCV